MTFRSVRRWGGLVAVAAGLTALLVACSAATTGSGATTGLGSLSVGFKGNPSGTSPSAVVAGTDGLSYYSIVTSPTTLKGLAPGSYEVTPQSLTLRRNVFGAITGSGAVTVAAGKTASDTVTYSAQPGDLWVPSGTSVPQYLASSLYNGTPRIGASIGGFGIANGAAFDANGDLWVSDTTNAQVVEYRTASLTSGTPQQGTLITGLSAPQGLAFDPHGNLWIANTAGDTVIEYTASSLAAGTPKTGTIITVGSNNVPADVAFDPSGNLWVSEPLAPTTLPYSGVNDQIVEYLASSLAAGTPRTGTVIDGSLTASVAQPLAFDASGNLWIGNFTNTLTIQEILAASLGTSTPKTGATLSVSALEGSLAFDAYGNLWTGQLQNDLVVEYKAAALTSGSPSAATTITMSGPPYGLAFDPPPYQLPLSH